MTIILFVVFLAGAISVSIALPVWYLLLSRIEDQVQRRRVESRCVTFAVIFGIVVFFSPTGGGSPSTNYELLFSVWLVKTLLIVWTPMVLLLILSSVARRRYRDSSAQSYVRDKYLPLEEAVEYERSAKKIQQEEAARREQKLRYSKRITALLLLIFAVFFGSTTLLISAELPSAVLIVLVFGILISGLCVVLWLVIGRSIYLRM